MSGGSDTSVVPFRVPHYRILYDETQEVATLKIPLFREITRKTRDTNEMAIPETMGERVREALRGAGLNATTAAKLLGVGRHTVSRWLNGDDIPERELARIAERTGRSRAWLRYGITDKGVAVERYVTGFLDGRERAIELLSRMEPEPEKVLNEPPADEKPPREMRSGEVPQEPLQAASDPKDRRERA